MRSINYNQPAVRLLSLFLLSVLPHQRAEAQGPQRAQSQGAMPSYFGARVIHVLSGGPAARAGLEINDVIERIDGKPITSVAIYDQVLRVASANGRPAEFSIRDRRTGKLVTTWIWPVNGKIGIVYGLVMWAERPQDTDAHRGDRGGQGNDPNPSSPPPPPPEEGIQPP